MVKAQQQATEEVDINALLGAADKRERDLSVLKDIAPCTVKVVGVRRFEYESIENFAIDFDVEMDGEVLGFSTRFDRRFKTKPQFLALQKAFATELVSAARGRRISSRSMSEPENLKLFTQFMNGDLGDGVSLLLEALRGKESKSTGKMYYTASFRAPY